MRTAEQVQAEIDATGNVWLGGEMEFPANRGWQVAYDAACRIAQACGYLVARQGPSGFDVAWVTPVGRYVCRWPSAEALLMEPAQFIGDSAEGAGRPAAAAGICRGATGPRAWVALGLGAGWLRRRHML